MFLDKTKPAQMPATQFQRNYPNEAETRQAFQTLPVNLSAAEIRDMVLEIIG